MLKDKKICVVLPAYNAAATLEATYNEIPFSIVDEVVLVDDKSSDETVKVAERLGIQHIIQQKLTDLKKHMNVLDLLILKIVLHELILAKRNYMT